MCPFGCAGEQNELTPTLTFLRIIGKSAGDTVRTSETQNPLQENAVWEWE